MKLPPMNALRAFEAVPRLGSVSKAAEELCVSQGAVSQQLRNLEDHLGREMFIRTPKSFKLSEDGEVLEKQAQPAAWCGGFPAPDAMNADVVKEFIHNTYDAYANRFGDDFGKTIQFSYGDEIGLRANGVNKNALPWSAWLGEEMKSSLGYDISPKLKDLFVDSEGAGATRFDYYSQLQRVFEEVHAPVVEDSP